MAKKDKRFIITEKQGSELSNSMQVVVDRQTGVNYLWMKSGNAGGITPLLDRDGKPIVTAVTDFED